MLKHFEIKHYALIEHLNIDIDKGFTVITGETGAGKSIIIGALALLMGQRADTKVIRTGEQKCIVEAVFDVSAYNLAAVFDELDIDYEDETFIRREVYENGKSRAFVNDTPVSLAQLKALSPYLIDIHSQHQNLLLNDSSFQLKIVDSVAQTQKERGAYDAAYRIYVDTVKRLKNLEAQAEQATAERDFAQFQFNQLSEANLIENEQPELENELELLNHAEEVKSELSSVTSRLDADEYGVLSSLKDAVGAVRKVARYLKDGEATLTRLESTLIELRDLNGEFASMYNDIEFNPQRKQQIEERLDLIYTLQQKHKVSSVAELIAARDEYENRLRRMDEFGDEIEALKKTISELRGNLDEAATALSVKRKSVKEEIENTLVEKLVYLGIENASCEVDILPLEDYSASGMDSVEFLFSANKNAPLMPVASIASGGEISRVMLSLKSLIAFKSKLPTIIFDEIDTGVSGEVANRIGELMRQIADKIQVLAITHLPQIASKGTSHFKVFKSDDELGTTSKIVNLDTNGRLMEIAEMLSGKNPSESAVANARELMKM